MKKHLLLLLFLFTGSLSIMAQWVTGGPFGGPVQDHVMIGNDMYVAVYGGGIYKTTDGGQTWLDRSNGIHDNTIVFVAYDGNVLYAASSAHSKIWRSTNLGLNWDTLPSLPSYPFDLYGFNSVLYLGAEEGLYASADSGKTWAPTAIYEANGYHFAHNIRAKDGNLILTMINKVPGTNAAANYAYRFHPLNNVVDTILRHDYDASSTSGMSGIQIIGDTLFISVKFNDGSPYGAFGLMYSYNNGATWDSAVSPYGNGLIVQSLAWDGSTLFTASHDYNAEVGTYSLSTHTFDSLTTGFPQSVYDAGDIFNIGSNVFVCAGSSLYQTSNHGNTWALLPGTGLTATPSNTVFAQGQQIYTGATGTVFYSADDGQSWVASSSNLQNSVNDIVSFNNALFAATANYGVYKSTDNGHTWIQVALDGDYLYRFGSDGAHLYIGIGGAGVSKSSNGTNWTNFGTGLPTGGVIDFVYLDGYIFAATGSPNFGDAGVYRSDTSSGHWQYMNNGWPNAATPLSLEKSGNTIYAGIGLYGVYASSDTGHSWQPLNHGIETRVVNDLLAIDSGLYAATDSGIYQLPWGDTSWINISGNLPIPEGLSLAANADRLFVAIKNGSVWQMPINNSSAGINNPVSLNFKIFPNPGNGQAALQIPAPSLSDMDLKIYDELGKLVYTRHLNKGAGLIYIDGQNWNSGIYYVQLVTKNELATQKMIITGHK